MGNYFDFWNYSNATFYFLIYKISGYYYNSNSYNNENSTRKLVAKVSGKIEVILIKDRTNVSKNTPLPVIENASNYNDVFLLKRIVDTIDFEKVNFLLNY
jgi:hypothetical protein